MITPLFKPLSKPTHLILDAGHGWTTPGKCSDDPHTINNDQSKAAYQDSTLREFEYNRAIVNRIAMLAHTSFLQGNAITYDFVSQEHFDLKLMERTNRGNAIYDKLKDTHRVMFVSIHANGFSSKEARGHSIHIQGKYLGKDSNGKAIYSKTEAGNATSESFAKTMDLHLTNLNFLMKTGIYSRKVIYDNLHITRQMHCPVILIESAFMTSPEDLKWLMDETWRNAMAISVFNGIVDFND